MLVNRFVEAALATLKPFEISSPGTWKPLPSLTLNPPLVLEQAVLFKEHLENFVGFRLLAVLL